MPELVRVVSDLPASFSAPRVRELVDPLFPEAEGRLHPDLAGRDRVLEVQT